MRNPSPAPTAFVSFLNEHNLGAFADKLMTEQGFGSESEVRSLTQDDLKAIGKEIGMKAGHITRFVKLSSTEVRSFDVRGMSRRTFFTLFLI